MRRLLRLQYTFFSLTVDLFIITSVYNFGTAINETITKADVRKRNFGATDVQGPKSKKYGSVHDPHS